MKRYLLPMRGILQEKLIKVILITGFFALSAVVFEELQGGETFRVLAIYLPAFFLGLLLFTLKSISPPVKSIMITLILTLLGFSELYYFGIKSMAFVFLLAAVILAALMYSTFLGGLIIGLSLVVTFLTVHLYNSRLSLLPLEQQRTTKIIVHWTSPVLIYFMLSVSCLVIIDIVLNTLGSTIDKKEAVSNKLRKETQALITANQDLQKMAYIDPVTNLPNNSKYLNDISSLKIDKNSKVQSIHLILVELIEFADFNIKYGIEAGNELLRNTGKRLQNITNGQVYREIGARFLIQGINWEQQAIIDYSKGIKNVLTESFTIQGELAKMNFKGADINFPKDIPSIKEMLSTLMMTLKESDHHLINTIIPYNNPNILEIQRRIHMMELLKKALEREEIYTYIQPRLDTKSGKISGGELLIRWKNPELGIIPPDVFIPMAEKETLIFDLTMFVLNSLDEIHEEKFKENLSPEPTFSINISPALFHSNQMYLLISRLEEKKYWADVEFELTEGVLIGKSEAIFESIRYMQRKKIGISIDDFGTGYSNIEYLQDLDADIIKIDKRFILGITHNEKQRNLVMAIINIAKALKLHIVAEGVEYREQYEWLKAQGVQEIQGFYLSKPLGFNDFLQFTKAHKTEDWI